MNGIWTRYWKRGYQWIWGLEYTNKTGFSDFCIVLCANHFLGEIFRVLLMCWICNEHFSGLADIWNVHGSVSMFFIPFVPKITFNLKFFSFQSEYGSYPQFLTWLITWWLMKKMKKSKRRIQKARFNFSSRFFVRIFISELKFAGFFPIYVSRLKSWSPLFSLRHMSPLLFFCLEFCPEHLRACGKFCNETLRASV